MADTTVQKEDPHTYTSLMEEEASPAWWERTDYLVTTVVKKNHGGGWGDIHPGTLKGTVACNQGEVTKHKAGFRIQ